MINTEELHPSVLKAEQLDLQGLHDDAINELALATGNGDLEAKTRLGKRLFSGQDGPHLPREAISFIIESAQEGHAEAAALSSVLQVSGVMGKPNWPAALQMLATAADRGWVPAQEQIALLISPDLASTASTIASTPPRITPPRITPPPSAINWMQAMQGDELERWLQTPAATVLHEDPLLCSLPSFISPAICERLINLSRNRLHKAEVYDPHHRRNIVDSSRTNSIAQFLLLEHEFLHLLIQEKMARACGVDAAQMEATAILHYAPGEEITNHFDFVDPQMVNYADEVAQNGQRIITFLLYLNDDYEEGETIFPRLGIKHKGQRGEGFYFVNCIDQEPDLRTQHAGCPPQQGDKWISSQFIRNHALTRL